MQQKMELRLLEFKTEFKNEPNLYKRRTQKTTFKSHYSKLTLYQHPYQAHLERRVTLTTLIFFSLRKGLFLHISEQWQSLEQLMERPLLGNLNKMKLSHKAVESMNWIEDINIKKNHPVTSLVYFTKHPGKNNQ